MIPCILSLLLNSVSYSRSEIVTVINVSFYLDDSFYHSYDYYENSSV